jgi:hypothetical protein
MIAAPRVRSRCHCGRAAAFPLSVAGRLWQEPVDGSVLAASSKWSMEPNAAAGSGIRSILPAAEQLLTAEQLHAAASNAATEQLHAAANAASEQLHAADQPQDNGLVVDVAVLVDTSTDVGVDAQESRSSWRRRWRACL